MSCKKSPHGENPSPAISMGGAHHPVGGEKRNVGTSQATTMAKQAPFKPWAVESLAWGHGGQRYQEGEEIKETIKGFLQVTE